MPALASAASSASGIRPARTATTIAVKIVILVGEPRPLTRARPGGMQPVARHHEEDPALAVEEGEDHGGQRHHRRNAEIISGGGLADLAQDQGQRLGAVGEAGVGERADRGAGRPPCR